MFAAASSGRLDFGELLPDETRVSEFLRGRHRFYWRGALQRRRIEARRSYRQHFDRIAGFDGGQRIACIDRPYEDIRSLDGDHFGNLRAVEQRGHARHESLPARSGRRDHMAVIPRQRDHQCGQIFRQRMCVGGRVDAQNLAHPTDFGRSGHHRRRIMPGDQQMDIAANLRCGSHGIEGRALETGIVVFSDNKNGHGQITLASLRSFSSSASISGTIIPLLRAGGSVTSNTVRRGVTSTPSVSGVSVSSGFFLAFMMFGSVT